MRSLNSWVRCASPRAWTDYRMSVTWKVLTNSRRAGCGKHIIFHLQPRKCFWKLKKLMDHFNEYSKLECPPISSSTIGRKSCAPAFTGRQVARAVTKEAIKGPSISTIKIAQLVQSKALYRHQRSIWHFRVPHVKILRHMAGKREVDSEALKVLPIFYPTVVIPCVRSQLTRLQCKRPEQKQPSISSINFSREKQSRNNFYLTWLLSTFRIYKMKSTLNPDTFRSQHLNAIHQRGLEEISVDSSHCDGVWL